MQRFRTLVLVMLAGCAPGATRSAAGPVEAELQTAANSLFAAMATRDTAALRAMFTPEARIVSVRVRAGAEPVVRASAVSDFVASVGRNTETLRERMWDPQVEVGGEFASLWAPYDFHVGDRFSHCGHDAFHFVRSSAGWKITTLSYTIRESPCETAPRNP